ncbi:MAG: hypothetical protein EPN22_12530 [Nitrospirae bacterium]|nr:MAG: hypothetical protein EPN22_12530 [Nitrospirota bacterium]
MEAFLKTLITLVIAIAGYIASKAIEYRGLYNIPKPRRDALKGRWEGTAAQHAGPEGPPSEYRVVIQFSIFWKFVRGVAFYELDNQKTHLKLFGGFYDNHILRLNYRNERAAVIQYGLVLLDFSSDTNQLNGSFLGYGHVHEQIVTGEISLERKL